MRKVMVSLLAIYIALSAVPVQAQTTTTENSNNMYMVATEDIDKTVMCNVTGNAFVVGTSGNMTENMTDNRTKNRIRNLIETQTANATGKTENVTKLMTCNVTGELTIIEDVVNRTESMVMIGKIDDMPGKVVIVGKTDKAEIDGKVVNMTGMEGKIDYMTVLMKGNMTGNITCNMTENMANMTENTSNMTVLMKGNMTGNITCNMTENMANMTENTSNMTVLMKGNMTGIITGNMTKKMIKIKNIGNTAGTAEDMINVTTMVGNMSTMAEPMKCNVIGNMILIKNTDNMTEMPEIPDNITDISEDIEEIKKLDQKMDNMTEISENIDKVKEMAENMNNVPGLEWKNNNSTVYIITVVNVVTNVINNTQIGLN
ncbi:hypothetical protein [Methanosarcina horonobensis]|nr:hypothetical protein [Methanosarcina horonobensis]